MKYERLTQWVGDGASLILDNPRNVEEAKEQLQDKFKLACIKLATLEDKVERGELVEVPKGAVVLTPEERDEVRRQAVQEFAVRVKMAFYYEFFPSLIEEKIDELIEEVCGE